MPIEDQLAQQFVCQKCENQGAEAKTIAVSGTGLSKIFDIQHNQFIAVSCRNCGYTELYNPNSLKDRSRVGDILDILFGG